MEKISEMVLMDNMEYMSRFEDKFFDVAIVDPPYGINASEMTMGTGRNKKYSKGKKWDSLRPSSAYFTELFRVSKNQIVWGGNYFADNLAISRSWIFWDKELNKEVSFADGELAWTSFDRNLKKVKIQYSGLLVADFIRIHNTQKPIQLYKWLLKNYANPGDKILDTHAGSQSSRIACQIMGFDFYGCEIDQDYYKAGCNRYDIHASQKTIFQFQEQ